jgi:hypothetical protein
MGFTLVLTCLFLPSSALSQEDGNCTKGASPRPDCPEAIAFFRTFQAALSNNDRAKVASLVSYPVLTSLRHRRANVKSAAQLLVHYDEIFDRRVRCAILAAKAKDVWGNWRGFTVDGGPIWFDAIIPAHEHPDTAGLDHSSRYPFKIIGINNDSDYRCQSSPGLRQ